MRRAQLEHVIRAAADLADETAKAPRGGEDRLVEVRNENTRGAAGWCLEQHDLVLAKCVAGREKDVVFAAEAVRHGLVDADELRRRVESLPVDAEHRAAIASLLVALCSPWPSASGVEAVPEDADG